MRRRVSLKAKDQTKTTICSKDESAGERNKSRSAIGQQVCSASEWVKIIIIKKKSSGFYPHLQVSKVGNQCGMDNRLFELYPLTRWCFRRDVGGGDERSAGCTQRRKKRIRCGQRVWFMLKGVLEAQR